jgi:hypothetical protein
MAQHSSIGLFASAVRGPLAGLVLGVTMAVIDLLAGGGPSLSTAMESIRLRPSAGVKFSGSKVECCATIKMRTERQSG